MRALISAFGVPLRVRVRTGVTIAVIVGGLLVVGALALGQTPQHGQLTEKWISSTDRDNRVNHHAVGVGPNGRVVVSPDAEVPHSDVEITAESCSLDRLDRRSGAVVWRATVPPDDCFTHALTQPAIGELDGDADPEVAVSTTERALVVYDARSGREEYRVSLSTYGYGRPTIANVTPAPGNEVVTSDIDGGLVAVERGGTVAWRQRLNATFPEEPSASVWDEPLVEDFDADGDPEIAVATQAGPVVLGADGDVEWSASRRTTYAAAVRADDDAAIELVTAGTDEVTAWDGATGEIEWSRSLDGVPRVRSAADSDDDGVPELFVGRVGGAVLALNAETGATEWSTTVAASDDANVPAPVLGDVNGDGRGEVVAVTQSGTVSVLAPDSGDELAAYERDVPIWTFAVTGDIDDDGTDEILVHYGDARVVALDYEPSERPAWAVRNGVSPGDHGARDDPQR